MTPVSRTWVGTHNIAMNESTGYAYGVGTNTVGAVDVSDPTTPMPAGTYRRPTPTMPKWSLTGPDADHQGGVGLLLQWRRGVAIVNVTDKMVQLVSSFTYAQSAYTHQVG